MLSELELEIQQHIIQHLSGAISLVDFEDWFAPVLWDIEEEDARTREMAGSIHILLSEFSHGDRTLESLRQGLLATTCITDENRYGQGRADQRGESSVTPSLAAA
jgi:hypothetical protein